MSPLPGNSSDNNDDDNSTAAITILNSEIDFLFQQNQYTMRMERKERTQLSRFEHKPKTGFRIVHFVRFCCISDRAGELTFHKDCMCNKIVIENEVSMASRK